MPAGFTTKKESRYPSFGGPAYMVLGTPDALVSRTTLGEVTISAIATFDATTLTYSAISGVTCDIADKFMNVAYNPKNGLVYLIIVDDTIDTINVRCTGIYLSDWQCPGEQNPESPADDFAVGDTLIIIGDMYDWDAVDTNGDPIWNTFESEDVVTYAREGDSQKHKSMGQTVKTVVGQIEEMITANFSDAWLPELQKFIDKTAKTYVTIDGKTQALYGDKAGSVPPNLPLLLLDSADVNRCERLNDDKKAILENSRFFPSVQVDPPESRDYNTDGSQALWNKAFVANPDNVFETAQIYSLIAWRLPEWPTDI